MPPNPKDIAQSDVVITYANLDDQPVLSGRQGWVSQLHKNLQIRVVQLSGKQVAVVKQPDPSDSVEIESAVLKHVPQAKTVVSVVSLPFARSNGCHRIVDTFWKRPMDSGRLEIGDRSRLLNVIKTPVDATELPPEVRRRTPAWSPTSSSSATRPRAGCGSSTRHLATPRSSVSTNGVYDVAYDISQVLKYLGYTPAANDKRAANPKTIFGRHNFGPQSQRDQLRRELTELGHTVLPRQPLPLVASELVTVVQGCLSRPIWQFILSASISGWSPKPPICRKPCSKTKVAAQFCGSSSLKRLIWIPKGQTPDERQASFIRQLQSEPRTVTGAELIADTLENLKVLLRSRWNRPGN